MANPNEPQNYGREISKEIHNSTDGHTDVTKTTESVSGSNAYKDGFVNGQVAENYQENALVARDNENAGRGLLIGILVASLAALTAGAVWFANQNNNVDPITPVIVPVPNRVESSPVPEAKAPETKTTIIQKTKEVLVPVPQQAAPAPQPSVAPQQNVNITVPPAATAPSPATVEKAPASSSSSSDMQSPTGDSAPSNDAPATNGSN